MLAGGPGVGKSRMLREYAALAEAAGFEVVRAVPNRWAANVPFGALALLLPEDATGASPADVLRRTAAALAARGKGKPVLLVVDDAHLLDDASATLIHHVVLRRQITVAVVLPSGMAAPDAVLNLWKDGFIERVELTPLGPEVARDLLDAIVGGPVADPAADVLLAKAAGNALFLRELVVTNVESGNLTAVGGGWRLTADVTVSPRLVAVVESRLGRAAEADQRALEVVALGQPVPLSVLHALVDADRLDHLERLGLLRVSPTGEVSLAHPLQGDVVLATIAPARRREVAAALADHFERGTERDQTVRIACWRLDAGGQTDADELVRAARAALRANDPSTAARLCGAAGGFEATMLQGAALIAACDYVGAEGVFAGAAVLAQSDAERATLAGRRAMNLLTDVGQPLEAFAVVSGAPDVPDDGVALARLLMAMLAGQQTPDVIEARLARFTARTSGPALLAASIYYSIYLTWLGRYEDAVTAADRGREAIPDIDYATQLASPYALEAARCVAQASAGHIDDAAEAALAGHSQAVAAGSIEGQRRFAWVLGLVNLVRGRMQSAVARMEEALAAGPGVAERLQITTALAIAKAQCGDGPGAAALLETMASSPEHWWVRAQAWVAASEGHTSEARRQFEAAAEASRVLGLPGTEANALVDLARIGAADAAAPRLDALRGVVQGPMHAAYADYAGALVGADAEALNAASIAFERLGAHLMSAEAAHCAGLEWQRRGLLLRAADAEQRVGVLTGWCETAYSPGLARSSEEGVLSPREREVAQLALSGLDNAGIAERLGVSKRTVASQLHRVYQKLGIGGRPELATLLGRDRQ